MKYAILLTWLAEEDFENIPKPVTRDQVARKIDSLEINPFIGQQAKYMSGIFTVRASSEQYIIFYRLLDFQNVVVILSIRKGQVDGYRRIVDPWKETKKYGKRK